jgi:GNAT superfamily N-acetyltransferase
MNRTSEFQFRESPPSAQEYLALFESTGWNQEYQLTAEDLRNAVRRSWHVVVAYDRDRLVGTGRVISDGVFHAFIVDVIVVPEYQAKGLGTSIMERLLIAAGTVAFATYSCSAPATRNSFTVDWDSLPDRRARLAWTTGLHGQTMATETK